MKPYEIILEIEKEQMKKLIEQMNCNNVSEQIAAIRKHCDILEKSGTIEYLETEEELPGQPKREDPSAIIGFPKKRREADLSFADFRFTVAGLEYCAQKERIIFELTRRGATVSCLEESQPDSAVLQVIDQSEVVILFTEYLKPDVLARFKDLCRQEEKLVYTTKQKKLQPLIVGIKNKLKSASIL